MASKNPKLVKIAKETSNAKGSAKQITSEQITNKPVPTEQPSGEQEFTPKTNKAISGPTKQESAQKTPVRQSVSKQGATSDISKSTKKPRKQQENTGKLANKKEPIEQAGYIEESANKSEIKVNKQAFTEQVPTEKEFTQKAPVRQPVSKQELPSDVSTKPTRKPRKKRENKKIGKPTNTKEPIKQTASKPEVKVVTEQTLTKQESTQKVPIRQSVSKQELPPSKSTKRIRKQRENTKEPTTKQEPIKQTSKPKVKVAVEQTLTKQESTQKAPTRRSVDKTQQAPTSQTPNKQTSNQSKTTKQVINQVSTKQETTQSSPVKQTTSKRRADQQKDQQLLTKQKPMQQTPIEQTPSKQKHKEGPNRQKLTRQAPISYQGSTKQVIAKPASVKNKTSAIGQVVNKQKINKPAMNPQAPVRQKIVREALDTGTDKHNWDWVKMSASTTDPASVKPPLINNQVKVPQASALRKPANLFRNPRAFFAKLIPKKKSSKAWLLTAISIPLLAVVFYGGYRFALSRVSGLGPPNALNSSVSTSNPLNMANNPLHKPFVSNNIPNSITNINQGISSPGFIWPLSIKGRVTSCFGPRNLGNGPENHKGVDIAAVVGTPVFSSKAGVIVYLREKEQYDAASGYGTVIYISHSDGMQTRYAHLYTVNNALKKGKYVKKGAFLGFVGLTGRTTGPHLHFEILNKEGIQVNPIDHITSRVDSSLATSVDESCWQDKVKLKVLATSGNQ